MTDHDPLCPQSPTPMPVGSGCYCHLIRQVRADERARMAEDNTDDPTASWHLEYLEDGIKDLLKQLETARADERERIAQAIEATHKMAPDCGPCAYVDAARIARKGGSGE